MIVLVLTKTLMGLNVTWKKSFCLRLDRQTAHRSEFPAHRQQKSPVHFQNITTFKLLQPKLSNYLSKQFMRATPTYLCCCVLAVCLHTCLLAHSVLWTFKPAYVPSCLFSHLPTCLLTYLLGSLHSYWSTCMLAYLHNSLVTYWLTHQPASALAYTSLPA